MRKKKVASKPKEVVKKVKEEVKPEKKEVINGIFAMEGGFALVHGEAREEFIGGDELSCFNEACKRYKLLMIS